MRITSRAIVGFACAVSLFAGAATFAAAPAPNLLKNADFSAGIADSWEKPKAEITDAMKAAFLPEQEDGKPVLHVKLLGEIVTVEQGVAVEPNKTYQFTFKAKGDPGVQFRLFVNGTRNVKVVERSADYRSYAFVCTPVDKGFQVVFGPASKSAKGDVYLKDFNFSEMPPLPVDVIATRATTSPVIDGALNDDCWKSATTINNFTVPASPEAPARAMEAKICYDDAALYLAVKCAEPKADIKADAVKEGMEVWKDDSVEIFFKNSDVDNTYDQLIVNSLGTRQYFRKVGGKSAEWKPEWTAAGQTQDDGWTLEVRIPFTDLGFKPEKGAGLGFKIGREDRHPNEATTLSTWPPAKQYGFVGEFGKMYFTSASLLDNADFSQGIRVGWGGKEADKQIFIPEKENDVNILHVKTPGGYAALAQQIVLGANKTYRFSVKAKGTTGVQFRIKTSPTTEINTAPSEGYKEYNAIFNTGTEPSIQMAWGTTGKTLAGDVYLKDFKIEPVSGYEAVGPAIPAAPGKQLTVTKLLVKDCRQLRGLNLSPVDGTTESHDWAGGLYEYGDKTTYSSISYAYNDNDGLNISLADKGGVDAIVIRKGAGCKLYADCPRYDSGEGGKLLAKLEGHTKNTRVLFKNRVMSDKFSIFEMTDGFIGDINFFRLGDAIPAGQAAKWNVGAQLDSLGDIAPYVGNRFKGGATSYQVGAQVEPDAIDAQANTFFHIISPALKEETGLSALTVNFSIDTAASSLPLTLALQDPFNPRKELMGADFVLSGKGDYSICMDFPDQVVSAGKRIWLSLKFGDDTKVVKAEIQPITIAKADAMKEALPYGKLLLLSEFIPLTEQRVWNNMKRDTTDYVAWARGCPFPNKDQVVEFFQTLIYLHDLAPQDREVTELYEWVFLIPLEGSHKVSRAAVSLDIRADVPQWAGALHATYLALREVPKFWLETRLVPTGEIGGDNNDDTDMYQNWGDFGMYESDGVGGLYRATCRNLLNFEIKNIFAIGTGIPARSTDALHYYEDGLNQMSLMAWLDYGNPVVMEQVMLATLSTEKGFTTLRNGERHFKNYKNIGGDDLRADRPVAEDGDYCFACIQPSLMTIWYNNNAEASQMVREWADTWQKHYKPGAYPNVLDAATDKESAIGGELSNPAAAAQVYFAWLLGDEKYSKVLQDHAEPGSATFATYNLAKCVNLGLVTVNARVKSAAKNSSVADYVVNGNRQSLVGNALDQLAEITKNKEFYTTFEPYTDRLFMRDLTRACGQAYLGGYYTRNSYVNSYAVSWEGFGTDYAALCLNSRRDGLQFLVYSFADKPMTGRMNVWLLDHGRYKVAYGVDANQDDTMDKAAKEETTELLRGSPVSITLAPRAVTVIEISQVEKLGDVRTRADLALSSMAISRNGTSVEGTVWNIGNQPADVVLTLEDDKGKVLQTLAPSKLEAPLDLKPRKMNFKFENVPADAKDLFVAVDRDNKVEEIYKGNNRVAVP